MYGLYLLIDAVEEKSGQNSINRKSYANNKNNKKYSCWEKLV